MYAVAMLATLGVSTTSCDDDDEDEIAVVPDGGDDDANGDSTEGANFTVSGDVSGVWEAGSVVGVTGHITVPEGQSLTIEEGVVWTDAAVHDAAPFLEHIGTPLLGFSRSLECSLIHDPLAFGPCDAIGVVLSSTHPHVYA